MPSTATSRTVTGLTNGTQYTFRVAGVNHTRGDYSASITSTPSAVLSFIVSGAGTAAANGTYSQTQDTYDGRPVFLKSGGGAWLSWQDAGGGRWLISYRSPIVETVSTFNFSYYYRPNSADANPPSTGWLVNDAAGPAPTVTQG